MIKIDIFRHERDTALQVAAGSVIFREGDEAHSMYVILEGTTRASVQGNPLGEMGAGEAFGEMALIGGRLRSATVTAVTDCALAEIGEKRFLFLVQQHPRFALQVMRTLVDRLVLRTTPGSTGLPST